MGKIRSHEDLEVGDESRSVDLLDTLPNLSKSLSPLVILYFSNFKLQNAYLLLNK